MEWTSFTTGLIVAAFTWALFSQKEDDEDIEMEDENIAINGHTIRHVTMSCQTCRKLKKHREIEPNLYQCIKCKRHVDLRSA